MNTFKPCYFRQQFPLIETLTEKPSESDDNQSQPIVYFDNAATTQKLKQVIETQRNYYLTYNANVHRASHKLSTKATVAFENSRTAVKNFIHAHSNKEIIWTKGATESLNIIVQCLAKNTLKAGDEIVLCVSEHHANIVPWQMIAEQTGAIIKVLPITEKGYIDVSQLNSFITSKSKFVACAHISNVLGRINPIEQIIKKAKSVGAISVIDGAQAIAHIPINVQTLDCDFYVFSAHKMFGPTGIGVLYGKQQLLENMQPYQGGGEMIKTVSFTHGTTFNSLPFKFEAGTPNISAVIAFGECVNIVSEFINDNNERYSQFEQKLTKYCYQKLNAIKEISFIVDGTPDVGVIAFTVTGHHNQDVASTLDSYGIAIRSGHHCAMPLMEELNISGCLRVSLAAYNTVDEIDYFIKSLKTIVNNDLSSRENTNTELTKLLTTPLSQLSMNKVNDMDEIVDIFAKAKAWDSRHREIMLLGKRLPRMDKNLRNEDTLIVGCESHAWLKVEQCEKGLFIFIADSDAKIIRGLLVIVLAVVNHKTAQQIHDFNINEYFSTLGLIEHLSPSRSNGLLAIVNKIKGIVQI